MHRRHEISPRLRFGLVLLLVPLVAGTAAAWQERSGDPDGEPRTTLEQFLHVKRQLRGVIANTQGRVRNRVVGFGDGGADPDKPAQVCCRANIEKIEKYVISMGPLMRTLQECYRAEGNVDGDLQVGFTRADVEGLFRAVREFRETGEDEFDFRYGAITRAFHVMNRGVKKLTECPSASDGGQ